MEKPTLKQRTAALTYLAFAVIIAAWTAAWLVKINLDQRWSWLTAGGGSFAYWTTAKLIVWIVPALWLIGRSGRSLQEVLGLANWKAALAWGGGIGLLIALTGIIPNYLQGRPVLPTKVDFPLLNVIVIAPTLRSF